MSTYEPGTVAIATVNGIENVRVFRTNGKFYPWTTADEENHAGDWVSEVRQCVVLDWHPSPTHVQDLLSLLREHHWTSLAEQIEAQTKPPHIPEPGLWGVVSTQDADDLTDYWTNGPGGWFNERGEACGWPDLPNPVLVRDGIRDES